MRRLVRAVWGESRGSAMIEFGFLCPVLFTILLGIIEAGRMFYVRQSLEYATEQAARYYMVTPGAAESDVTMALRNAMAVHAACGGSTNLLLHIPAVAYSAGLRRPKPKGICAPSWAGLRGRMCRCC